MAFRNIMCFGNSSKEPQDPNSRRNADIERQIKLDMRKAAQEVKLLLLGGPPFCDCCGSIAYP